MSKMLDATVNADKKVICEGVEIPTAVILSEGQSASQGVLLLEEDKQTYITKQSPDLKTLIEKVITHLTDVKEALEHTASALSAIDGRVYVIASGSPDTFGPPVATGDIANLSAEISSIESAISDLGDFKEVLK